MHTLALYEWIIIILYVRKSARKREMSMEQVFVCTFSPLSHSSWKFVCCFLYQRQHTLNFAPRKMRSCWINKSNDTLSPSFFSLYIRINSIILLLTSFLLVYKSIIIKMLPKKWYIHIQNGKYQKTIPLCNMIDISSIEVKVDKIFIVCSLHLLCGCL